MGTGTIWLVNKDFHARETSTSNNEVHERKVLIEKGEIIEFRYESERHFRDMYNKYWVVDTNTWNECCLKIGKIWEKVRFGNKATLKEIWQLNLFDENKDIMKIYREWKEKEEKESE